MPLTDFKVHDQSERDGAVIHALDGRKLVIGEVSPLTFGDYFGYPLAHGAERRRLTKRQCNLLAHTSSNLEALSEIIAAKYERAEYSELDTYGQTNPVITVTEQDMR